MTESAQVWRTGDTLTPRSYEIGAGSSLVVRVTLNDVAQSDQAIYFALEQESGASLVLYEDVETEQVLNSSVSPRFFMSGRQALASTAASLDGLAEDAIEPSVVAVTEQCPGICIIRRTDASSYLLEVDNTSGTSQTFTLYLYSKSFEDEYEFTNNSAPGIEIGGAAGSSDSGAIEYVGDVDYWDVLQDGTIFFEAITDKPAEIQLRLELIDAFGTVGVFQPGETVPAAAGDTMIVYEDGGNAAGPSGFSWYSLSY